jgi:hypothetical protein
LVPKLDETLTLLAVCGRGVDVCSVSKSAAGCFGSGRIDLTGARPAADAVCGSGRRARLLDAGRREVLKVANLTIYCIALRSRVDAQMSRQKTRASPEAEQRRAPEGAGGRRGSPATALHSSLGDRCPPEAAAMPEQLRTRCDVPTGRRERRRS